MTGTLNYTTSPLLGYTRTSTPVTKTGVTFGDTFGVHPSVNTPEQVRTKQVSPADWRQFIKYFRARVGLDKIDKQEWYRLLLLQVCGILYKPSVAEISPSL